MKALTYFCTFFGTAACTFVGASQNTPRTWEGWLFLIVGSLGSGAISLKALITEPSKHFPES